MQTVDVALRYRLWLLLGIAILLTVAANALGEAGAAPVGNLFFPVPPCRMLDTRLTATPLTQGEYRNVTLTGDCGIPQGAAAVSMNLAAANIQGGEVTNGVVKVGLPTLPAGPNSVPQPCGIPNPCEAWLNYTKPYMKQVNNSGVAVVNSAGQITIGLFQGGGTADIIVDVNGYYIPGVQAVTLIGGTVTCPGAGAPSWSVCNSGALAVSDARVKAGMVIATSYSNTTASDTQIPIRISNIHDGGFTAQFQAGTTFMWIATTP